MFKTIVPVTAAIAGLVVALGIAAAGPASASVGSCSVTTAPKSLVQGGYYADRDNHVTHSTPCRPTQTTSHTVATVKDAAPGSKVGGKQL